MRSHSTCGILTLDEEVHKGASGLKENMILKKMTDQQQVIGTFFETIGTSIVECLGIAGLDFFIVDFEHSTFTAESLLEIVHTAELREMSTLMRIKEISRSNVLRPLDVGVQGLIIPNIRSVEEVKDVVRWGKYAPVGERGFFLSRVTDFGFSDTIKNLDEFFVDRNNNTLIIPQCETVECLEAIEEICALDGVDGIFVGPFDLTIALGIPAQFDHPLFTDALARIYKASRDHNKFTFIFGADTQQARAYKDYGFDAITCSMDASLLIQACMDMLATVKAD